MRSKHSDSRPVFGHGDQGERRADLVRQQHPACRGWGQTDPVLDLQQHRLPVGRCQVKSQWGAVNLTRPDGTLRQGKSAAVESADAADLDPVADLRAGWHTHVAFGLANAALFGLLHDPERAAISPASGQGLGVLRSRVYRLAAAGRLCVSEQRAVEVNKQSVLRQPVLESSGTHQQRGSDCRPGAGR